MVWRSIVSASLAVALGGCAVGSPTPAPTQPAAVGPKPIVVPLDVRWSAVGARPMIMVRVGNGPRVPVLLDTGSTGLHIYTRGVRLGRHSGVTVTGHPDSITFADGTVERGVVARAKLTVGSVTTSLPVSFGLIDSVSCVAGIRDCPGTYGIAGRLAVGEYGILGVGLARHAERLGNPLLALPAPYSQGWSIELDNSTGVLVLRPHPLGRPIARFPLKPDGRDPTGARDWHDDETKVCWATVDLRGAACEPTVFDSGSETMLWYGGLLSRSDTSTYSVIVNPGEYIAAWQPGTHTPFWTFTSGTEFSQNTVIAVRGGHPVVIAAVQSFLAFNIVYDDILGRITLYQQSVP